MKLPKLHWVYWVLVGTALLWGIGVLVLNAIAHYYPEIERKYPFDVTVVGSVSDWVMVMVTAITGIAIWKTLNTAMQSQNTQDALLREEIKRTKILLQPIISADKYDRKFWMSEDKNVTGTQIKKVFMVRISSKERFARNINV